VDFVVPKNLGIFLTYYGINTDSNTPAKNPISVAMGGDLPPLPDNVDAPVFMAYALRDVVKGN